jgi:hypothetical protein
VFPVGGFYQEGYLHCLMAKTEKAEKAELNVIEIPYNAENEQEFCETVRRTVNFLCGGREIICDLRAVKSTGVVHFIVMRKDKAFKPKYTVRDAKNMFGKQFDEIKQQQTNFKVEDDENKKRHLKTNLIEPLNDILNDEDTETFKYENQLR